MTTIILVLVSITICLYLVADYIEKNKKPYRKKKDK